MTDRIRLTYHCDICKKHHSLGIACPSHYPSMAWAHRFTFKRPVYAPKSAA